MIIYPVHPNWFVASKQKFLLIFVEQQQCMKQQHEATELFYLNWRALIVNTYSVNTFYIFHY
jgi:hypothetical protein